MKHENSNAFDHEKLIKLLRKEIHPNRLEDELEETLRKCLKNQTNLEAEALANFIGGFCFGEILQKKSELLKPLPGNPGQREVIRMRPEEKDIEAAIQETINLTKKTMCFIDFFFEKKGDVIPIEVIELIDQYNQKNPNNPIKINNKIRRLINLSFYNLDEEKARKGIGYTRRFSFSEVAEKLSLNHDMK